jgi:sugar O-acyltransferase (sialic acid O-acetyltransferase NeuD family)
MDIYLYGCGGHAKVVLDILERQNRIVKAFVDDNPPSQMTHIHGVPVWKTTTEILLDRECDRSLWIVAIGNNRIRRFVAEKLEGYGCSFTTAIHPSAEISRTVEIDPGTVIMPNAVINTDTKIGSHVIVNTGTTIDHDCLIKSYSHIAPGSHICGQVKLEEGVFLGVGTKVVPSIVVGENTTCGAGSVVVKSLPSHCLAYGCPAKIIKENYF